MHVVRWTIRSQDLAVRVANDTPRGCQAAFTDDVPQRFSAVQRSFQQLKLQKSPDENEKRRDDDQHQPAIAAPELAHLCALNPEVHSATPLQRRPQYDWATCSGGPAGRG